MECNLMTNFEVKTPIVTCQRPSHSSFSQLPYFNDCSQDFISNNFYFKQCNYYSINSPHQYQLSHTQHPHLQQPQPHHHQQQPYSFLSQHSPEDFNQNRSHFQNVDTFKYNDDNNQEVLHNNATSISSNKFDDDNFHEDAAEMMACLQQPHDLYDLACALEPFPSFPHSSLFPPSIHATHLPTPTNENHHGNHTTCLFTHDDSLITCCYKTSTNSFHSDGSPSSPYDVKPRRSANARERGRTLSLNSAFQQLQASIPTDPPDRKLSKIETIRLATTYIAHLQTLLHADEGELNGTSCVRMKSSLTRLLKKGRLVGLDVAKDGELLRRMLRGDGAGVEEGPTIICTFCLSMSKALK